MALFPPGFRTVAKQIGLPGFRAGQKFGDARAETPVAPGTLTPAPPPSTILADSTAVTSATIAAQRQRKRAAGGTPKLQTQPVGPRAVLTPKTLVGY